MLKNDWAEELNPLLFSSPEYCMKLHIYSRANGKIESKSSITNLTETQ